MGKAYSQVGTVGYYLRTYGLGLRVGIITNKIGEITDKVFRKGLEQLGN